MSVDPRVTIDDQVTAVRREIAMRQRVLAGDPSAELWVECHYDDKFEVSNLGRVRRITTQIVRKPIYNRKNGYYQVTLASRTRSLQRLVLDSFYGPLLPKMHRAHLDGEPANNRLYNLDAVSPKEKRCMYLTNQS